MFQTMEISWEDKQLSKITVRETLHSSGLFASWAWSLPWACTLLGSRNHGLAAAPLPRHNQSFFRAWHIIGIWWVCVCGSCREDLPAVSSGERRWEEQQGSWILRCACQGLGRGFPWGHQSPLKWAYSLALYSNKKEQPRVEWSLLPASRKIWEFGRSSQGRAGSASVGFPAGCFARCPGTQDRDWLLSSCEKRAPSWWFGGSVLCLPRLFRATCT